MTTSRDAPRAADGPGSSAPAPAASVEEGTEFTPRFTADGLIPAIVTDAADGTVLMFAWMNRHALDQTLATGRAHFWSRSRGRIWVKGEESGNTLTVEEVRTDCDQDVLWLKVTVGGHRVACHTGRRSCFYRIVTAGAGGPMLRFARAAGPVDRPPSS